jgi:thiamine kinase
MLADVSGTDVAAMATAIRPDRAAPQPVRTPSLVHTDCGPGNIVRSGGRLVLIDWQCPGLGDPVEDLACVLSPAMLVLYGCRPLSVATTDAFLDAYPDADTVARYRRDAEAWHFRIAAYCAWRSVHLADTEPEVAATYRTALAAELARSRSDPS